MTEIVAAVSLHYVAGDSIKLEFAVTIDGEAASLMGATTRFAIARRSGQDPVIESPDTATVTVTDQEGGVFQVEVDGADTEDLRGTYQFEAELEDSSGDKSTVSRGYITFSAGVIQ